MVSHDCLAQKIPCLTNLQEILSLDNNDGEMYIMERWLDNNDGEMFRQLWRDRPIRER